MYIHLYAAAYVATCIQNEKNAAVQIVVQKKPTINMVYMSMHVHAPYSTKLLRRLMLVIFADCHRTARIRPIKYFWLLY